MRTWTHEQEELLKRSYSTHTNLELLELFPGRTFAAIHKKARKLGLVQSKEVEFINRSNAQKLPADCHKKTITQKGYVQIYAPDHPRADSCGRVLEHIVVFEMATGITVPTNCSIHHLNGNKQDNRIENLCMMENGAHTSFHHTGKPRSEEAISKIRVVAKKRFENPKNHPSWREIDMEPVFKDIANGAKVNDVCSKYGISKTLYYSRLKGQKHES